MNVLFDQGTPVPLRLALSGHAVSTSHEMGWSHLTNGELLKVAEESFDLLITTDKNLRYQQNLTGRRLAILVLPTTSWPVLRTRAAEIATIVADMTSGEFHAMTWSDD